jgi:hypothetical protein
MGERDQTVGLIAGAGRLPVIEALGMRAAGKRVVCLSLGSSADADLHALCDRIVHVPILNLGSWLRKARRFGFDQAVMVGRVPKTIMYDPWAIVCNLPDWRVAKLWFVTARKDRRSQTLLTAIADELQRGGLRLIDTTRYIPDHLADAGVMTRTQPGSSVKLDIEFGWPILQRLNELEIGQSLAVRGRDVVAVEAIEGTDRMIERAGQLARGKGWVLCKGSGKQKDPRFDVPTIGVQTIENLAKAGAKCLAVQVGKVILIDKPAVLAAADRAGIAVVGV